MRGFGHAAELAIAFMFGIPDFGGLDSGATSQLFCIGRRNTAGHEHGHHVELVMLSHVT